VDKQQQLEGVCMDLKAANSKRNYMQLFRIVKSMTRKFHPRLQGIQSATGKKNLLKLRKLQTGGKGIVKTCTVMRKETELNKSIGSKSLHHLLRSEVAPAIRHTATRAKPQNMGGDLGN